jgi:hypothetical protein
MTARRARALMAGRGKILAGAANRWPPLLAGGSGGFRRRVHAAAKRSGPIEHDAAIATLGNNDGRPIVALERVHDHRPKADGAADGRPIVHVRPRVGVKPNQARSKARRKELSKS